MIINTILLTLSMILLDTSGCEHHDELTLSGVNLPLDTDAHLVDGNVPKTTIELDECWMDVNPLPIAEAYNDADIYTAVETMRDTGGVVRIHHNYYDQLTLTNIQQTEDTPIYFVGVGNPVFGNLNTTFGVRVESSSYLFFTGLYMTEAIEGMVIYNSHHIVAYKNTVTRTRQGAFMVRVGSMYVDIIDNIITDLGVAPEGVAHNPQWAEGIYVGAGHLDGSDPTVEKVWIEGNQITRTGCAEAVNVKPEAFNVTVHNNTIHDITPGCPGMKQSNLAAISIEPAGFSGLLTETPREIWVTDNNIDLVHKGKHGDGILATGSGVNISGNTLSNIALKPISIIEWGNLGLYINVGKNAGEVHTRGGATYGFYPLTNPNSAQDWHNFGVEILGELQGTVF